MNKRAPMIILGVIIAVAAIGISSKPLLIKYYLYKYSRIPAISHILIAPYSFDLSDAKNDINLKSDILSALQRLGYLTSFSIPITTPSANAEELISVISTYTDLRTIPLIVGIDDTTDVPSLYVIDKPGTQPFWESFVRFYIEAKEGGQQGGPAYPPQGVGSADL
jgi:hypothetical protein